MKTFKKSNWLKFEEFLFLFKSRDWEEETKAYPFSMDDKRLIKLFEQALEENEEKYPAWIKNVKKDLKEVYDEHSGRYGHIKKLLDYVYAKRIYDMKGK